jgi:hypothetical protein
MQDLVVIASVRLTSSPGIAHRFHRTVACVGIGLLIFLLSLFGTAWNEYRSVFFLQRVGFFWH